jgi:nucleotide-binding universal stress UspA family protein
MQPFTTMLFAADFSENSKEVFRTACLLAVENQTRMIVLHVAEPDWVPEEPVPYGQQFAQFRETDRNRSYHSALRHKLRDFYAPKRPIEVQYQLREGQPSVEILHVAKESGADLIVMGTHGRTGLSWLLAGSVAIAVLRGAQCPVLALRFPEMPRDSNGIRVILHPTDFSVESEGALRVARGLAQAHGARLIILHVAMLQVLMDGTSAAEIDPRFYSDTLEDVRQRVDGPDLKYPVETMLRRGYEAELITQTAEEIGCDLIVMGTHGRTGLSRLLMGSVAENVLPKANCPVLVVKPAQKVLAPTRDRTAGRAVTVF